MLNRNIVLFVSSLHALTACDIDNLNPPPPLGNDAVWCDIKAIPCILWNFNPYSGLPTSCAAILPEPVAASAAGAGDRTCFDSATTAPEEACAALCNPFSFHLDWDVWPVSWAGDNNIRRFCSAGINRDPGFHTSLNDRGFQPNHSSCVRPISSPSVADGNFQLSSVGTVASELAGVGTITFHGSSQNVGIRRGYFNIAAPNTSCSPLESTCATQINQAEIVFNDFSLEGVSIGNLTVYLNERILTASGRFVPGANRFIFTMPQGISFDAVATVNGSPSGLRVTSDRQVVGSLDPLTGAFAFQFSVSGTVSGNAFTATGVATSISGGVIELAPTVAASGPVSVDAVTECSATTTLTAIASSPVNLPVMLTFVLGSNVLGSGNSISATLPIGENTIAIVGIDSLGGRGSASQIVTVVDRTPPEFAHVPELINLHSCNTGAGPVNVPVPAAKGMCSGDTATVTGEIIELDGTTVSIPIVGGQVILPQSSGIIRWTAHGTNGVEATISQAFKVYPPAVLYTLAGLTSDKRSVIDGAIFNATGGPVLADDNARLKDVFSLSPVTFGNRVTAVSVVTPAIFTPGERNTIGVISTSTPNIAPFPAISAVFTGGTGVHVVRRAVLHLVPGQYGEVIVDRDGKLNLGAGDYYFTSLSIRPGAQLIVPDAQTEVVRIFVRDRVGLDQSPRTPSGNLAPTYLAYTGNQPLNINEVFSGTIVAPNALLRLLDPTNGHHDLETYRGEFFASEIFVEKRAVIESAPFTCK
jgi:hypothetical protein